MRYSSAFLRIYRSHTQPFWFPPVWSLLHTHYTETGIHTALYPPDCHRGSWEWHSARCVWQTDILSQAHRLLCPTEILIAASIRESVISHGKNTVVFSDNAGSYLCIRILGAHPRQHGNTHKIFIPWNVVFLLWFIVYPIRFPDRSTYTADSDPFYPRIVYDMNITYFVPKILSPASPSPGTI